MQFHQRKPSRVFSFASFAIVVLMYLHVSDVRAQVSAARHTRGDFDLNDASIPVDEILGGGPQKDGIPAITTPLMSKSAEASFMRPTDRVVGVSSDGLARAYPIAILTHHEVVNDRIGEVPIAVTYCPLCDSVVVLDRRTQLGELEFGVSGLLYNSNVLLYDRSERESLWSQLKREGVSGPARGMKLQTIPMELTTWKSWVARNPTTEVMSNQTGFRRNYRKSPYVAYFRQPNPGFPVRPVDNRLPAKHAVLGIWDETSAEAIPIGAFRGKSAQIERTINGKRIVIEFSAHDSALRVVAADEGLSWIHSFWFAWYAFWPHTDVMTDLP